MARLGQVPLVQRGNMPEEDQPGTSGTGPQSIIDPENETNSSQEGVSENVPEQNELLGIITQLRATLITQENALHQAETRSALQQQRLELLSAAIHTQQQNETRAGTHTQQQETRAAIHIQQQEETRAATHTQQQGTRAATHTQQQKETRAATHTQLQQEQTVSNMYDLRPTSLIGNFPGGNADNSNISTNTIDYGSSGNVNISNAPTIAIGNRLGGNPDGNQGERPFTRAGSTVSLSHAKEAAIDFEGNTCARNWVEHLKNIGLIYNLTDDCLRMLFVTKLKGNAQRWLHVNPTRMLETFERLCKQLIVAFGETASKSELRRRFEQRKWQRNERFTMYFEEKKMMSQTVNMDMEELLEHLIEGIPSASLRDQARIQRFANPEQMLLAFANVRLPQQAGSYVPKKSTSEAVVNNLRCRNCNSKGHFAKDCRKPSRAPGSCFACGEMGDFVGECRLRKSNINSNTNHYSVS
ncbi:uncharacterized protein LOC120320682 [Drosophila yakuba]|uniref:uncharacterized protein LOC120320682 n=1 Tax=Drosophila yakuba TaxID=7245 RepID=UPI0019307D18|nr:uncharacterized protein LOC120320682 [Drosophila yakuba]